LKGTPQKLERNLRDDLASGLAKTGPLAQGTRLAGNALREAPKEAPTVEGLSKTLQNLEGEQARIAEAWQAAPEGGNFSQQCDTVNDSISATREKLANMQGDAPSAPNIPGEPNTRPA